MSAAIIELADRITAALALAILPLQFTPERTYTPRVDLKDADTLHVLVVPKALESKILTRASVEDLLSIDIGVIQRSSVADPEALKEFADSLMEFTAELAAWFDLRRIDGSDAQWLTTSMPVIFDPAHLRDLKQFTTVITVTYRLTRGVQRNA